MSSRTSTTVETTTTETGIRTVTIVETRRTSQFEARTTTETVHFSFGPMTTVSLALRKPGQAEWVEFTRRLDA
jgi:hypothetical protein